ncbi:MAG: hypothetical protein WCB49_03575 [Gammaproteobacteria bacterium]
MNETIMPLLNEDALDALNRTRPWMYLIGICSLLVSLITLLAVIGGIIGINANPQRAHLILTSGFIGLIVSLPSAIVQLGYAFALSRVNEASGAALDAAVELACIRQRNLWVVNAIIASLLALIPVFSVVGANIGLTV